jgi:hypothetical protein
VASSESARLEKIVGDIDSGSGRLFIEVKRPGPTDLNFGTMRHSC